MVSAYRELIRASYNARQQRSFFVTPLLVQIVRVIGRGLVGGVAALLGDARVHRHDLLPRFGKLRPQRLALVNSHNVCRLRS